MKLSSRLSFHHDQPLFGLDIGHSSMKIVQLARQSGQKPKVLAYGVSNYYPSNAIANGVIVNFEVLAHTMRELLRDRLTGNLTTTHVACSVPTSHTYSRPMTLPPMANNQIEAAVKLEAEQYIPVPLEKLYLDYDISRQDAGGIDLLLVATPKNIVDSCIQFLESVGFMPVALEPTMNAAARLFSVADLAHAEASLLIDFGSITTDIAVFDQSMFVNSTISGGSDTLTDLVAKKLNVIPSEAYVIKSQYGIGPGAKTMAVLEASRPILEPMVREVRKIMRYYDEHAASRHRKISQIITTGGGATLRGLNEYLARELGVPSRRLDPWPNIDFGHLTPPTELASSMYVTATGEAILSPEEIFS